MTSDLPYYTPPVNGSRIVLHTEEMPRCEALRICVAFTSIIQLILISKFSDLPLLSVAVQFGFAVSGYLITSFLLRGRNQVMQEDPYENEGLVAWVRSFLESLPVAQMILVVAGVVYLPRFLALDNISIPEMNELPAMIVKTLNAYFADFQKPAFDGKTLPLWPLFVLVAPRRTLSLLLLTVVGSALVMQFAGLFAGDVRPMSIMAAPSAFDFLSIGSFLSVITNLAKAGESEGQIGRWSVVIGLALASLLLVHRFGGRVIGGGSLSMLSAPVGFGVANFALEIVSTFLIFSLFWRDFGLLMEEARRSPAH